MPFASGPTHISKRLMSNIQELPLWVKQVIFLKLHADLTEFFASESLMELSTEDTVAFFVPLITHEGEAAIPEIKETDIQKLLTATQQKVTVLDLCLAFDWSLEHCAQVLIQGIKGQWIHLPSSRKVMGTIEYLANRIRLGEYLLKMGRITQDQLNQALRTQQYIKEAMEEHSGIANILINLGYITRKDTEGILMLKDEASKPMRAVSLLQNQ